MSTHDPQTDRLILRRWRESDLAPFAHMNADPRVMQYYPSTLTPVETRLMIERIQAHFALRNFGLWAAELRDTGDFVGYIGLNVPNFRLPTAPHPLVNVEIGWRLAHDHWGKGLATEGASAVLHYAFTHLKLAEVISFTVPGNLRSRRVMEKIGMTHNPADDFDHPRLPTNHRLSRHVLYRKAAVSPQLSAPSSVPA